MNTFKWTVVCLCALLGVTPSASGQSAEVLYESEHLKIERISKNVFVHVSYLTTNDFGKVACNGAMYVSDTEALIFDTPTTNEASRELIRWLEEQQRSVHSVIVTHFHDDCLGGLQAFSEQGIPSYAHHPTIELARKSGVAFLPTYGFDKELKTTVGESLVHTQYFGEGHTIDNVVVYMPAEGVLFGGCLIKSMQAGKGYLGDANVAQWSSTVRKIKEEWPEVKVVIPGHGAVGGTELLDYTIALFASEQR